jgi:hypothetical protein
VSLWYGFPFVCGEHKKLVESLRSAVAYALIQIVDGDVLAVHRGQGQVAPGFGGASREWCRLALVWSGLPPLSEGGIDRVRRSRVFLLSSIGADLEYNHETRYDPVRPDYAAMKGRLAKLSRRESAIKVGERRPWLKKGGSI